MAEEIHGIKSASGRELPVKTLVEVYWTPLPGKIGVEIKLPGAKRFEDLGEVPIENNVVQLPFRIAFIAYDREDKTRVLKRYQALLERGIMPWMDIKNLIGGQRWDIFRTKALKEADHCLIFLSMRSIRKIGEFQREIRLAVAEAERRPEESNYLIPVKLEECSPPSYLGEFNWINLYEKGGMEKLILSVRGGECKKYYYYQI